MFYKSRAQALLDQLDQLIDKHQESNPEIASELRTLRSDLQQYTLRENALEWAKAALRASSWIKFILDHWPDG